MRTNNKITLEHLSRTAVVYIRQSTARQVQFNEESTKRQYALKDLLIDYGWPQEMVEIIDDDLGISGKYSENRAGFQKLVGEVANGNVGVIACIEASRLSRNSSDWSRIIDYCAMTSTLIMDEETIYNPLDPNDRLLLGVKGSLTEMELHNIRMRMQGGLLNKVKRGELRIRLPIGYAYDALDRVVFDPNKDVQSVINKLFSTFSNLESVYKTVQEFNEHNILFPALCRSGLKKGEYVWQALTTDRALFVLKHPFYTGRYVYGRDQVITTPLHKTIRPRNQEEWLADIPNHHPAYITEETFQRNLSILERNAYSHKGDGATVPGKGNALLQGVVYCGRCGKRMNTGYQKSLSAQKDWMFPLYICDSNTPPHTRCMVVNGTAIDEKISELLVQRLTPEAVADAIEVKKEIERRWSENEKLLELRLQKAEYEATLMRKRYLACDPDNALVRIDIEKAYNECLSVCAEAKKALDKEREKHTAETETIIEERLSDLVTNFESVWNSTATDIRVKKRLVQSIIKSVTLTRENSGPICKVQIVYTGGGTDEFSVYCRHYGPNSIGWKIRDYLQENGIRYTPAELAEQLNQKGLFRNKGKQWSASSVSVYMSGAGIKTKTHYYTELGYLTGSELCKKVGISHAALTERYHRGWYEGLCVKVTDHLIMYHPDAINVRKKPN